MSGRRCGECGRNSSESRPGFDCLWRSSRQCVNDLALKAVVIKLSTAKNATHSEPAQEEEEADR